MRSTAGGNDLISREGLRLLSRRSSTSGRAELIGGNDLISREGFATRLRGSRRRWRRRGRKRPDQQEGIATSVPEPMSAKTRSGGGNDLISRKGLRLSDGPERRGTEGWVRRRKRPDQRSDPGEFRGGPPGSRYSSTRTRTSAGERTRSFPRSEPPAERGRAQRELQGAAPGRTGA